MTFQRMLLAACFVGALSSSSTFGQSVAPSKKSAPSLSPARKVPGSTSKKKTRPPQPEQKKFDFGVEQPASQLDDSPEPLSPSVASAAATVPSAWFPDWGRSGFDWTLGPLIGLRYQAEERPGEGTLQTATTEIGLRGGLSDIPLLPGNPGLGLGLHAAQAWGTTAAATLDSTSRSTKAVNFTRTVAGLRLSAYYHWLRQELAFTQGRLTYSDEAKTLLQSQTISHDLGVLLLSWLSTHYTYTYLRAYGESYSIPLLVQHDHWLHARMFTSLLKMYLDIGPGWTKAEESAENIEAGGGSAVVASGHTNDLRLLSGMHLFWKIGASAEAKYVYRSSSDQLGTLAGTRLPADDLADLSQVALPEDSLRASLFAGIRDLFFGLSVGWRYQVEVLNMSSEGDKTRRERSAQGPVLGYTASF